MATLGKLVYQAAAMSHPHAAQCCTLSVLLLDFLWLHLPDLYFLPHKGACTRRCTVLMHYDAAGSPRTTPKLGGLACVP